jgi:hypothetical protein
MPTRPHRVDKESRTDESHSEFHPRHCGADPGAYLAAKPSGNSQEESMNIDLSIMPSGSKPRGFTDALTGHGGAVRWQVLDDPSAPPDCKVIAETSGDATNYRFPICIFNDVTAKNVNVSVRFKPIAGSLDQAGGLIVRVQNPDNYYVARANALEDNVNLYKVVAGERRKIANYKGKVSKGIWHTLSFKVEDDLLEVAFDGKRVIQTHDQTFTGAGKIGLWTKADSLTHFVDLQIYPNDKSNSAAALQAVRKGQ